ncbi:hypothetical protein [Oscillatoria sp. FACHB-1406]|uniref:hypothetical protein n=1 Tax=Oscillatoria sp. FACHB-1406 TaxID=2692846 RepID=UPI001F553448|nr:hypothetical protein [Oscillatoria sp. FACHB-1406]
MRADSLNLSLEAFILQTLSQSLPSTQPVALWPEIILSFKGIPDFLPFESYRDELLPPREPEVF